MTVPSFSFSLKDVADLAARLSVQIASQHGLNQGLNQGLNHGLNRHQPMASMLADAGIPATHNTHNTLGFRVSLAMLQVTEDNLTKN